MGDDNLCVLASQNDLITLAVLEILWAITNPLPEIPLYYTLEVFSKKELSQQYFCTKCYQHLSSIPNNNKNIQSVRSVATNSIQDLGL